MTSIHSSRAASAPPQMSVHTALGHHIGREDGLSDDASASRRTPSGLVGEGPWWTWRSVGRCDDSLATVTTLHLRRSSEFDSHCRGHHRPMARARMTPLSIEVAEAQTARIASAGSGFSARFCAIRIESLWSQARRKPAATSGKRSQPQKPPEQAKTLAMGCQRLRIGAHGREGSTIEIVACPDELPGAVVVSNQC
jgi:hypothetical protein